MKKLLLTVFVFTSVQSFGQGILSRLSFGIKAGGNYSDFSDAGFDTEGLAGFHAGAIVNFRLSDKFSIQEDFLFSTQGAKLKSSNVFSVDEIKLSYVSVPLVLKYHSNLGIYLEAGPQFNILVTDAEDLGFEEFADKIDAGLVGGLGYQFRNGPVKGLGIGARYYMGLTDVGKFSSSNIQPTFKNAVAQASVFYIF